MMTRNNADQIATHYLDDDDERELGECELRENLERSLGLEPILHKELSHAIVGAAIEVHRRIGPGMIERVYQNALAHEFAYRAIPFVAQAPISIIYRGEVKVGEFLADFIVDDKIILEIKAVERYHPVHRAQVYSYLGAAKLNLGMLINFDVPVLYRSISRIIRR